MTQINKMAFSIGNDDIDLYLTAMKASEILQVATVSRVDEDAQKGYQRHLSEPRAKLIAEYLDSGNLIPGAVILSAQENSVISFSNSELSMELIPNSLFVIDGQHRLYGAHLAEQDIELPVCIFKGLEHTNEVQYFIDINSNQKGVPKTLRLELLKFLAEEDSLDAVRARLFDELGNEPDSPLYGKLSATSSSRGKISHVPFQAALDPILKVHPLSSLAYDDKKRLLSNYTSAVQGVLESTLGGSEKLTTAAYFEAVFSIFGQVCGLSMMYSKSYSASALKEVLEGLKPFNFAIHTGTNRDAIKKMSDEMQELIEIHSHKLGSVQDLF